MKCAHIWTPLTGAARVEGMPAMGLSARQVELAYSTPKFANVTWGGQGCVLRAWGTAETPTLAVYRAMPGVCPFV